MGGEGERWTGTRARREAAHTVMVTVSVRLKTLVWERDLRIVDVRYRHHCVGSSVHGRRLLLGHSVYDVILQGHHVAISHHKRTGPKILKLGMDLRKLGD